MVYSRSGHTRPTQVDFKNIGVICNGYTLANVRKTFVFEYQEICLMSLSVFNDTYELRYYVYERMIASDGMKGCANRWRILIYWFSIDKGDECQKLG
jgi:hypothetical protein